MDENELDPGLKGAIVAYFEGWELVEFLRVPIEVVVEYLEEYIVDNVEEVSEFIGYEVEEDSAEDDE